jgi:hypothetical protein
MAGIEFQRLKVELDGGLMLPASQMQVGEAAPAIG